MAYSMMNEKINISKSLIEDDDFIEFCAELGKEGILHIPANASVKVENISGNINRVRRITFIDDCTENKLSIIFKHLPQNGQLERYPDIYFPENRLNFEYYYYKTIQKVLMQETGLHGILPELYYSSTDLNGITQILIYEDLYPSLSMQESILMYEVPSDAYFILLSYRLSTIHAYTNLFISNQHHSNPSAALNRTYVLSQPILGASQLKESWRNSSMQQWRIGFQEKLLNPYTEKLLYLANELHTLFQNDGFRVLTHGDLHANSIFINNNIPVLIDTELCDEGAAWFDTGMILAHLWMLSEASNKKLPIQQFFSHYQRNLQQYDLLIDWPRFFQNTVRLACFEVIRRTLGVANASYLNQSCVESLLRFVIPLAIDTPRICEPKDIPT